MASVLPNKAISEQSMKEQLLHEIFQCIENDFSGKLSEASKEFWTNDLRFCLVGASYTPSPTWKENDYFVSQISLSSESNLVMKISDVATQLILLNTLGPKPEETGYLELKELTEFEAITLTSYNEFLYKNISDLFLNAKEINSVIHTVNPEKTLYLTFYIYTNDYQEAGRMILSFPEYALRKTQPIEKSKHPLKLEFFNNAIAEVDILIGKTSASLDDVKNLEKDDLIVLDYSNIHTMHLKDFPEININIRPNSDLVISFDDEEYGEDTVSEQNTANNIWDSLEVDVNAGFEKVKMKLGDLRDITEGLVVDVASVSDNKVYIDVEGKHLASGELVIIGDKYGVKITEVFSAAKSAEMEKLEEEAVHVPREESQAINEPEENMETDEEDLDDVSIDDEDFDESDFDIDDDEE